MISGVKTRTTTHPNGATTVTQEFKLENRKGFLELLGKHHNLWTGEIDDPDEVLSRLLGIPKALLPASLNEPPAIDAEVIAIPDKSEERSLALARNSTAVPADVALDASREHDLEKRPESELPQHHEPTPEESIISNPLTPEEIEALRRDKKSAVEYGLKAFMKLDSEKAVSARQTGGLR